MTITAADTKYRYEGNGVTSSFSYPNRVYAVSDLKVDILTRSTSALVETLTLTTDYSVTIASNGQATVTVTNGVKIPSGTQDILLRLDLPLTQTVELPTGTPFPAKSVENAIDKLTSITQALDEVDSRSIKFSPQSPISDATLPEPVDDATIVFDGTDGSFKIGPTVGDIEDAADNAAIATAAAATAAASAAALSEFDLSGTPAANDAILWDTGVAKFVRKTLAQLRAAIIPYTPASASGPASLAFAEDTDNGTNTITISAPSSIASNRAQTLPDAAGEITVLGNNTTGTGNIVRDNSPTLITPTLGVASATSMNFGQGAELNYYDEGTFTPVVAGSTTPGTGATYTYQFGYYVRQGSVVRFHIYVDYSGLSGATGTFRITGLPFTSRNVANMFWSAFVSYQANLTVPASAMVSGLVPANTSRIDLYSTTTGGGTSTPLAIDGLAAVILYGEYFV